LFRFFVLFSLGSFKCGVGGGRRAPYDRYFSYSAKILEKGCPTWPDNRGCTVFAFQNPGIVPDAFQTKLATHHAKSVALIASLMEWRRFQFCLSYY